MASYKAIFVAADEEVSESRPSHCRNERNYRGLDYTAVMVNLTENS